VGSFALEPQCADTQVHTPLQDEIGTSGSEEGDAELDRGMPTDELAAGEEDEARSCVHGLRAHCF
jgi:hypothetical protein